MTDKIEELKKQCKVDKYWDEKNQVWIENYFDVNMFAALIIKESITAIEIEVGNWRQLAPFNDMIRQRGVFAIKQRFGIK